MPVFAATIQVPVGITQEASGPGGANVTFSVTASGNGTGDDENGRPSNGTATVSCSPASGSLFAIGTMTVSCTASDTTSTATASFDVVVADTTAPALSLPSDISAQASSPDGASISFSAAAIDVVDGSLGATCTPGPGLFPVGATTVTCSAADAHGNRSSGSFTVTVAAAPATRPPTLTLPADITAEATSAAGAVVTYDVQTSGAGGGPDDENGRPTNQVSATCSPASGSTFPLGTTTVQCTATDTGGTTSGSFNVTVVDTTAPDLHLPAGITVQASSNDGAAVTYDATATDAVDGAVAVTCAPASGAIFPIGTTSVSCTASDSHGNSATGGFDVSVTAPDAPPPAPTLNLPDDITAEAGGPDGAVVTFTATSSGTGSGDDENGRPNGGSVTCAPASGSLFPLGTTTVQCSAGSTSGTFLIHVVDTTAPVLALPADITTDQATVTFDATATDLVDGSVAVTCAPPSGSTFAVGTTAVTCSASDAAGNGASGSFNVTVTDSGTPARIIIVTATPDKIWPPNKNFVPVTVTVSISDHSQFTAHITSVSSSENDPNDRTTPDWVITGPLTVDLRAEKSERAQKRVYTIVVEVVDDTNSSYLKTVTVSVVNTSTTSVSQLLKVKSTKRGTPATAGKSRSPRGRR